MVPVGKLNFTTGTLLLRLLLPVGKIFKKGRAGVAEVEVPI